MNLDNFINLENFENSFRNFKNEKPFPFAIVDDFFKNDIAAQLENEIPEYDGSEWFSYENAIEIKKACNNWNYFPKLTYEVFTLLNSKTFTQMVASLTGTDFLESDMGLNGGGWHIHPSGGKLNTHLDYSLHPKLGLERKFNIIIYLNSNWKESWGGPFRILEPR